MKSTFGKNLKVTISGGSHEDFLSVIIDGFPDNTTFNMDELQKFMKRRAPGNSPFATKRKEADIPIVKSYNPLEIVIENTDKKSSDYKNTRHVPRPGHADFTAFIKYKDTINMAGGGPFSARMTAPLCVAGGIAIQLLEKRGIKIGAHLFSIGDIYDQPFNPITPLTSKPKDLSFPVISPKQGEKMKKCVLSAKEDLDSIGGVIEAAVTGLPQGLGGPMYDGVECSLSQILFGIPAVKGVEFGNGFASGIMRGSQNNDSFIIEKGEVKTKTNNHGGLLGGITTGMPLICRVAFKPTPSIGQEQDSVDLVSMKPAKLTIKGRHDPCVVVRAIPIVEAALAIGLLDKILEEKNELK